MNNYTLSKSQITYLVFKRLFDLLLSLTLLIILAPLLIIVSILIKFDSKGPVIFKQKRTGKEKKIFTIYKFRTMVTKTSIDGRALTDKERKTYFGNLLRKTSVDELPQIFNIIKGEMSFIGPRPFLINDINSYTQEQEIRFKLLPGITSWASIHGRNNQTIQQKYNHEVFYVKNVSLKLDMIIFFKTLQLIFSFKDVDDNVNKPRIAAHIMDDFKKNE